MQPVIRGKYFLTSVLLSNERHDAVLCRKLTTERDSLQKYVINVYKDKSVIKDILPNLANLKQKYSEQYIEHYVDESDLHIVLRHSIPSESLMFGTNLNIIDGMEIADNLFIHVLKLGELSAIHLRSLINFDNIIIGKDKSIYFSNILRFLNKSDQISGSDIVEQLGNILIKLFENHKKLPKSLLNFIHDCCNKNFDSVSQAYSVFKTLKNQFEEVNYNFKQGKKLFGIILVPFSYHTMESNLKPKTLRKVVVFTILICFSLTCISLWAYDKYFKKAVPVDNIIDIKISEPVKEVVKPVPQTPVLEPVKPPEKPAFVYYTVKEGDILSSISKKYYKDAYKYQIIADYNKLTNPNLLTIGTVLKIPLENTDK